MQRYLHKADEGHGSLRRPHSLALQEPATSLRARAVSLRNAVSHVAHSSCPRLQHPCAAIVLKPATDAPTKDKRQRIARLPTNSTSSSSLTRLQPGSPLTFTHNHVLQDHAPPQCHRRARRARGCCPGAQPPALLPAARVHSRRSWWVTSWPHGIRVICAHSSGFSDSGRSRRKCLSDARSSSERVS